MIRNIKALGLMAVAALAMSAMFASAAQAVPNGVLTAGLTPGTHTASVVHGEQYGLKSENFFKTPASEVTCENAGVTFTGNVNGGVSGGTNTDLTITPTYKDCLANGLPATVVVNGCTFTFNQPESEGGSHTTWTGTVDLVCPTGKVIEVEVFLGGTMTAHNTKICTVTVLPAKGLGHVTYHNITGVAPKKDDLTVTADVANVPVEEHGAACPDGNTKAVVATYKSNVTLTAATAGGSPHDLWISTGT